MWRRVLWRAVGKQAPDAAAAIAQSAGGAKLNEKEEAPLLQR